MRKGDTRREQILLTAESLFYVKGYEQTSIQDILDALHFSKGGFYHHFDSKLSLLEAICDMRAEDSYDAAAKAVEAVWEDPVAALNAMLDSGSMFRSDKLDYITLLLRVAYRDDGALMREKLKQSTLELMTPLMNRVLAKGVKEKLFSMPHPKLAGELVLRLSIQFTDEVAYVLAKDGEYVEKMGDILAKLELYRHTVERMLSAPFGSIILYSMDELSAVCDALTRTGRR